MDCGSRGTLTPFTPAKIVQRPIYIYLLYSLLQLTVTCFKSIILQISIARIGAVDLDTRPQMARRPSASRLAALLLDGVVILMPIARHTIIETTGVAVDIHAPAVNTDTTRPFCFAMMKNFIFSQIFSNSKPFLHITEPILGKFVLI